ncbi:hypothetical protein C2S53_014297 [Perilla frutescens var. hirtella]|uniref:Defensin-like protein n=1 Tax=Perilla frutescens var. hirtella TaxID=608512 RepID=A0AAD4J4K4_PERFH|nr:hypothetical protein C2S53_014297 [Perilla frutescens var. hirtella]
MEKIPSSTFFVVVICFTLVSGYFVSGEEETCSFGLFGRLHCDKNNSQICNDPCKNRAPIGAALISATCSSSGFCVCTYRGC